MTPRSKKDYLETIYLRYKWVTRKEKSMILNEFYLNCDYHRKHAIRILNKFRRFTKPKKKGNLSLYNKPSTLQLLERNWLTANLLCSKRLKVILPLGMPYYAKEFGGLPLDVIKSLLKISTSTIDRLLKPTRIKYKKR